MFGKPWAGLRQFEERDEVYIVLDQVKRGIYAGVRKECIQKLRKVFRNHTSPESFCKKALGHFEIASL